MKKIALILLVLFSISCQQNELDEKRIEKIADKLIQTDFTKTEYKPLSDIVMIGDGLKTELIEIKKNATEYDFSIAKGDLKSPYGDNKADGVLKIMTDFKNIGIRIKFDEGLDKYHILGYMTLED